MLENGGCSSATLEGRFLPSALEPCRVEIPSSGNGLCALLPSFMERWTANLTHPSTSPVGRKLFLRAR